MIYGVRSQPRTTSFKWLKFQGKGEGKVRKCYRKCFKSTFKIIKIKIHQVILRKIVSQITLF